MVRVVSLVPSATETLLALGVTPVACTRFCEQPGIPTVGGTKNPELAAIVALAPDLVVVNDEENRLEDAEVLSTAGLRLHPMSPRTVADVGPAVRELARALGVAVPPPFDEPGWAAFLAEVRHPARGRACTLIWRRPWMSQRDDTYGSSVLATLGWGNPFAGAASRYPETDLDALAALAPDLLVLPDEPYAFTEVHAQEAARALPRTRVRQVDGRDLFWWGARTPAALTRLDAALAD